MHHLSTFHPYEVAIIRIIRISSGFYPDYQDLTGMKVRIYPDLISMKINPQLIRNSHLIQMLSGLSTSHPLRSAVHTMINPDLIRMNY